MSEVWQNPVQNSRSPRSKSGNVLCARLDWWIHETIKVRNSAGTCKLYGRFVVSMKDTMDRCRSSRLGIIRLLRFAEYSSRHARGFKRHPWESMDGDLQGISIALTVQNPTWRVS